MIISNERQLLPIIRNAVIHPNNDLSQFIDTICPLFDSFLIGDLDQDEYRGWTFDILFFKATCSECETYHSAIMSSDPLWLFFSEGKEDCSYVIPQKGLIRIHLHSFLWQM